MKTDRTLPKGVAQDQVASTCLEFDSDFRRHLEALAGAAAQLCGAPLAVLTFSDDGQRTLMSAEVAVSDELIAQVRGVTDGAPDELIVHRSLPENIGGRPLIVGEPAARFLACSPVRADQRTLGALSVVDTVPRPEGLTSSQSAGLQAHSRTIANKIALRRGLKEGGEQARLQARILESATDYAIVALDRSGRVMRWNEGARRIFGWTESEVLGDGIDRIFTPEDRLTKVPALEMDTALNIGRAADERWHVRRDGGRFWASGELMPLRAEDGLVEDFLKILRDRSAHRAAAAQLEESERRYRLAARATNDAIWDWDLQTDHLLWNEAVQALFGYTSDEVGPSGTWWKSRIHPEDLDRVSSDIHEIIDGTGEKWTSEYRFLRADGTYARVHDRGYVLRDGDGRALRMIGAMIDVTERTEAEERRQLLTRELQHRVKNTLALVQAIAQQTFRKASDVEAACEAFAARLISLGEAHDLLTSTSWTAAPIRDVVDSALKAHRHGELSRIRVSGPDVRISAKPALSLALAIHELATNAAKYGALSNSVGFVELRWHVLDGEDEPRFALTWSEHGGPLIVNPPARKGFGLRLIERSFASEVQGVVQFAFGAGGLICRLEAPMISVRQVDPT